MSQIQNKTEELTVQSKVYDSLFIAVFGKDSERSKRWRLELYNALSITLITQTRML